MDSGPLIALMIPADRYHHASLVWLAEVARRGGRIIVPIPVVTEVCLWLEKRGYIDEEAVFLRELHAQQNLFELYSPSLDDLVRMSELVTKYAGFPLGTPDASVIVAAEVFGLTTVATVDERHFRTVVPRHATHFNLVPPLT
jgi:predicted nucleic acid-binding protein